MIRSFSFFTTTQPSLTATRRSAAPPRGRILALAKLNAADVDAAPEQALDRFLRPAARTRRGDVLGRPHVHDAPVAVTLSRERESSPPSATTEDCPRLNISARPSVTTDRMTPALT